MSVLSLQVWHALKRPPIHHPLFQRTSHLRPPAPPRQLSPARQVALTAICCALFYISLRYFAQLVFVVLFLIPLGIVVLYMLLNGTFAGLYWATRISGAIAHERERGTFELLSTSPYGAFSASWAICTGCQYYDQIFNGTGARRVWFSRVFFLTLLFFGALVLRVDPRSLGGKPLESVIYVIEITLVLAFAFYIDDIHSTVIGSLVGVIVPLFARNRLDARVGAVVGFLSLQITAYTLVWVIGFMLLPQLNADLGMTTFAAEIILPIEVLLVFFAVREVMARLLWSANALLLDGDVSDLRLLSKGGRLIC